MPEKRTNIRANESETAARPRFMYTIISQQYLIAA